MATNKNAQLRHRVIDECLMKGKNKTLQQIMDACTRRFEQTGGRKEDAEFSTSTIKHDFVDMRRRYKAPIEFRNGGYCYTDPTFSAFNNPLTDADVQLLNEAMGILKQFQGFRHFAGLEEMTLKLEQQLTMRTEQSPEVVDFEKIEGAKGLHWLQILFQAILQKTPLNIQYEPFQQEEAPSSRIIHPYLLKEFNNRWYLIAHDESRNEISNLGLDRIVSVDKEYGLYQPCLVDLKQYFENIIGVTVPSGKAPEQVVLRISSGRGHYVRTKPLHHSQQTISDDENGLVVSLHLIPNRELLSALLSFGKDLTVVEPASLGEQMRKELQKAAGNYGE